MDRRHFLRTSSALGALTLSQTVAAPAEAAYRGPRYSRKLPPNWTYPVVQALLPFGHGVMSGDPLPTRVILWTRITIPDRRGWDSTRVKNPQGIRSVRVRWTVARDPEMRRVVNRGIVRTGPARDWTVKVDAPGLPPATTLYYCFEALGYRSPVGRTRTAPRPSDTTTEVTIAHAACTSWWHDRFNGFARIGERNDLDLITHAGDHVYDNSGGHPASRVWKEQWSWDKDIDNADWSTIAECRRRYALYYSDANLMKAHHAAPFAIMADQHDYDPSTAITAQQAGQVLFEWTPIRPVIPDGSGRFPKSPGRNAQVPTPKGDAALYSFRSLRYGALTDVILIDVRRFARRAGEDSQILGDAQWAWLERTLLASKSRGARHRVIVNQVNLSQLRVFNMPFADQICRAFKLDPNGPSDEIYTTAWGGRPGERARLYRFLRQHRIVDNIVLSGDSHGWFGSDLVEDPQAPNYEPLTGGGLLGAVGVEMVGSTMGRPGAQDVIAEELYFRSRNGSRGAAFRDASRFDATFRPAALAPTLALETAAQAANPNLRYFNWRTDYGHTMVHLRPDHAVIECWSSPQRVVSTEQKRIAAFRTPIGRPHLAPTSVAPVRGRRSSRPAPAPRTRWTGTF